MDCVGISLLNSSNSQLVSQQGVTATQELWDSDLCILPGGRVSDLAVGSSDFMCWPLSVLAKSITFQMGFATFQMCFPGTVSCIYLYCYKSCRPLKAWSCFSESWFQVPFPEPCDFSLPGPQLCAAAEWNNSTGPEQWYPVCCAYTDHVSTSSVCHRALNKC